MQLSFWKYHGLGNDFILCEFFSREWPASILTDPQTIIRLCDRHRGIGADGLILLGASRTPDALASMRIFNADGSEAEMCGNGIRCAARLLRDHVPSFHQLQTITFDTGAGHVSCNFVPLSTKSVPAIQVDMGKPSLLRASIPMIGEGTCIDEEIVASHMKLRATALSMGNPHLVIFLDGSDSLDSIARSLGPVLEHHASFPNRTNVEFARLNRDEIEAVVWERGCGITLACGTGACAIAVAAVMTHRKSTEAPIPIRLPGGVLSIRVADDLSRVWLQGPAEEVFRGEIEIED